MRAHWAFLLFAFILPLVGITAGCAEHPRYYDPYYRDYHVWRRDDDHYYRRYRTERHEPYRDFRRLDRRQQEEYWRWRHDHDHDHDRH